MIIHESELRLERFFKNQLKKRGVLVVRKSNYINQIGCPDRLLIKNGKAVFVELKKAKTKPTKKQIEIGLDLKPFAPVFFLSGKKAIMEFINNLESIF